MLAGEVDTLAGQCTHSGDADGDASEALFSTAIEGIACLSNCSILVADPSSRTVRIITPDGDCPGQPGSAQNNGGTHPCNLSPFVTNEVLLRFRLVHLGPVSVAYLSLRTV